MFESGQKHRLLSTRTNLEYSPREPERDQELLWVALGMSPVILRASENQSYLATSCGLQHWQDLHVGAENCQRDLLYHSSYHFHGSGYT